VGAVLGEGGDRSEEEEEEEEEQERELSVHVVKFLFSRDRIAGWEGLV
jgi:hypothetical protein